MTYSSNIRAETLKRVDEEWQQFVDVAKGVPQDEQFLPSALGQWTARDLLIHIAAWDDELVKQVESYRSTGEKTAYGDSEAIDSLNQARVDEKLGLSLGQVWETLIKSHQNLLRFLQRLPEETFIPGSYTGDHIAIDLLGHYREHREDLKRWQTARR